MTTAKGAVRDRAGSFPRKPPDSSPRPPPPRDSINANHLAPAIWWPDTGQASSGTFHVTFLPLRLSQGEGLLPVALGDEKQAPGVKGGVLGPPASPGQGPQLQSCRSWTGGVKATERVDLSSHLHVGPREGCDSWLPHL